MVHCQPDLPLHGSHDLYLPYHKSFKRLHWFRDKPVECPQQAMGSCVVKDFFPLLNCLHSFAVFQPCMVFNTGLQPAKLCHALHCRMVTCRRLVCRLAFSGAFLVEVGKISRGLNARTSSRYNPCCAKCAFSIAAVVIPVACFTDH